jgi:hypothetical protein
MATSGTISGTPHTPGGVSFTARVTDATGLASEQPLAIQINAEPTIVTEFLPDGVRGLSYYHQLVASEGSTPYAWTDKFGTLIGTGLSLDPDGLISGQAVEKGEYEVTAVVIDAAGASDERLLTLYLDGGCCQGIVGDVNGDGQHDPTIGDVSALIDHLFISTQALACLAEADVNQSGSLQPTEDDITIGDVSNLIDHLFVSGSDLPDCL